MRTSLLTLATAGLVAVGSTAFGQNFVESFETLPTATIGGPPGLPVALPSGSWYVYNASVPLGSTGVSRLPAAAGGTTPFAVNPGDGSFYASMNFNNSGSPGNINTFLATPVLPLENGDTLRFITRGPVSTLFPDRMRVVMSTSNSANPVPGDFTAVLLSINETLVAGAAGYPQAWTEFTATVSGLPPGTTQGRLAFNYNVPDGGPSGANGNLVGIDRATFTKIPEPASMGLLLGAAPFVLRRRRA